MFTVQDLAQRFGLHPKSVRERLSALGPLVEPHIERGRNNAILLTDAGLAIFDRLIQLERDGFPTATAVERIRDELSDGKKTSRQPEANGAPTEGCRHDELIEELRDRVEDLRRREEDLRAERDRLLTMLEDRDEQLRALMPGPGSGHGSTAEGNGGQGRERMSRWEAFRYALLGR